MPRRSAHDPFGDDDAAATLRALYAEPHRHYHNRRHIRFVCACLSRWLGSDVSPALFAAALWHDAIYDPTRSDNEARSASLCARALRAQGVGDTVIERAVRLIEATRTHVAPDDGLEMVAMLDADLWILGASGRVYDRYVALIRAEYAHVAPDVWRAGRAAVLTRFLERPRLYLGNWPDVDRRERRARRNLIRERDSLIAV